MSDKLTDALLPVHMVGSYPRPQWYRDQLLGRDLLDVQKVERAREAFEDAVGAVIRDQQAAGLDVVSDGQMHYDDYAGSIGSFVWYWYERVPGFVSSKLPNPGIIGLSADEVYEDSDAALLENWGGTQVLGEVSPPNSRLVEMFRIAQRLADRPVKVSVGAGPVNLGLHVDFSAPGSAYASHRELAQALAPIFNRELKALAAAGCEFIQLEDLGAWLFATDDSARDWVIDVLNQTIEGVDAKIGWHCCLGTGYGSTVRSLEQMGLAGIIEPMYEVGVDQLVLDFSLRGMRDVRALANLPKDKEVAIGVIDVRALRIESDDELRERMHAALEVVAPEQVWFSTDCGMKALPRFVAQQKLKALVRVRDRVRAEL